MGNVEKLITARDKIADVYQAEAIDEYHDNGNLISMHQAIIHLQNAIDSIQKREKWVMD